MHQEIMLFLTEITAIDSLFCPIRVSFYIKATINLSVNSGLMISELFSYVLDLNPGII